MQQPDKTLFFLPLLASACLLLASAVHAGLQGDSVSIREAWVRKPVPGAAHAAAFFTLHNDANIAKQLSGVQCDASVARVCEMHQHIHSNGKMHMQKITEGLTIPANSDLRFSPGSYHVMLLDVTPAMGNMKTVELVFTFADQSTYHAHLPVKPVNEE
ncbi:MAG TPA: copper chaperone PCu(A)C [Pseudomonadales bacterium]|nr:copper chaperone PCu(A)C [Pseudomonadales bacterium]